MFSNIKNIEDLIYILGVKKTKLIFLVLLILLSGFIELLGLGLIAPYVSSILKLDSFTNFNFIFNFDNLSEKDFIFYVSILLIVIFLLKTFLSIFIKWYIAYFSYTEFAKLQSRLMLVYQKMDYEEYINRNVAVYIRNIRELCSHTLTCVELTLKSISEIIILSFVFLFLFFHDFVILSYIILVISPIIIIYEKVLKPINFKLGDIRIEAIKGIFKNADSGLRGSKEIRFLSKDNFFREKLLNFALIAANKQAKSFLISDSPRYIFEFVLVTFAVTVMFFLNMRNLDMQNYIPTISVFIFAGLRILPSISLIVNCFNRISHFIPSVGIVLNDIKKNNNRSLEKKKKSEKNFKEIENIKFENVKFIYRNSKEQVFENLNFEIKKNQCIGIVGESGSGKTTFVDILLGLLEPSDGKILINGMSVQNYSSNLMGNIAYLPQEPIVLDESVQTNIALEEDIKKIDKNKLEKSIQNSNLTKVIQRLDRGVETLIGENGIRLSGGQNKRLALARTFYHGKNFLILDEATSSLDKENENYIAEQINELKGKFTIIIISHQMNFLRYCDKIYKIENKKILPN